ncbi:MAG: hypothetical protein KAT34_14880 [Candidatus Aminicenantes bacterium]|nr:hypothetical protein [Candidatus Aminicenantes bacterium]
MEVQTMNTVKQVSLEAIKRLPDQCTIDDIMYEINFIAQVYEGLKDAEEGKPVTTEESLKRADRWAKYQRQLSSKQDTFLKISRHQNCCTIRQNRKNVKKSIFPVDILSRFCFNYSLITGGKDE